MPTTTGMKAGGFYDAHSGGQRSALDAFLPWLEEAVADLPLAGGDPAPVGVMDIGSSEGANALYALDRVTRRLRAATTRPLWLLFSDLPTNDFNRLFANLYPGGTAAVAADDAFVGAVGGTAFGRLTPPKSLHIATTFNAIGFLDKRPDAGLPNFILPMGPGPLAPREGVSVSEAERAPYRRQAEQDLHNFYAARAEELVPGGKLLVQVFGRDDRYSTSHGIYDVLSDAVLDGVDDGTLDRAVYERLVFPIYFRTVEELVRPIEADDRLAGCFRLERHASHDVPIPFNTAFAESGDRTGWAKDYTGFLRAFTEAILAAALPDSPPQADTLESIYERVEQRLIDDPARYEFHFISVGALLTRRQSGHAAGGIADTHACPLSE